MIIMNKFFHLAVPKKSCSIVYMLVFLMSSLLTFVLFVTTPLDIKHGRLCCKAFDNTMKRRASYKINKLGLLSGRQNIYQHLQN